MRERAVLVMLAAALAGLVSCRSRESPPPPVREIKKTAPPPVVVRSDDPALIEYTLRFGNRQNHYIDVEAVFPAGQPSLELTMAVWTPGSYLVREYSRHIEGLGAATLAGEPLPVTKLAKNRWRVDAGGAPRVAVRYRVYSRELAVRTNYVDSDIAVIVGAATFLRPVGGSGPFDLALDMPAGWSHSVTALEQAGDSAAHRYVAPDFDTLIDSPIVAGNAALYPFDIDGVPHVIANFGEAGVWDGPRSAKDVEAIARAHVAFWGSVPYRRYVFLNVLMGQSNGLEHKESTLITFPRWATRKREDYLGWLGLVSHEFFHTWNVKRLRPDGLGPFDYETETYTPSLWIAEGITSYYDDLLVRRAGLIDEAEYLEALSKQIEAVQTSPGRAVQSLSESSLDAWIKFYRPNENSGNTQVSYYAKGAAVGFLLDAEIRRLSQGRRSLDDVMLRLYERFSGERGFRPEDVRAVVGDVAGQALDEFFARFVDGTDELDFGPALALYGLRFAAPEDKGDKSSNKPEDKPGYLGVTLDGRNLVETVLRGTPAYEAGLNVGDELVAIDEFRVEPGALDGRLEHYRPGDKVRVTVARHGLLRPIEVTLGDKPTASWKLEVDPRAPGSARERRLRWLGIAR